MKSRIIRILCYGILVWLVSASYSHYQSSIYAGGSSYHRSDGSNLFTSVLDRLTPGDVKLKAKAALVIDAQTGEIIYAKNREQKLPIASLTKLTTVVVVQKNNPEFVGQVTISKTDFP